MAGTDNPAPVTPLVIFYGEKERSMKGKWMILVFMLAGGLLVWSMSPVFADT
jgi:hypothetical protein